MYKRPKHSSSNVLIDIVLPFPIVHYFNLKPIIYGGQIHITLTVLKFLGRKIVIEKV